jgi:lactoylglutathione lyase
MPRIDHIAVKVNDLNEVERFYEEVFGFTSKGRSRSEDRDRATLTNGEINLIFLKYDSEEVEMAKAVGEGPSIHHFAIEVENMDECVAKMRDFGCEILSDPKGVPVKFRMPGGPIAEIIPVGRSRRGGPANEG